MLVPPLGIGLVLGKQSCVWVDSRGFPGLPAALPPARSLPLRCHLFPHSYQLAQRTFHTLDFYKKHQEAMTPAGLAFFQCRWDDSVTHTFHQLLGKGLVARQAWGQRPFLPCQEWPLKVKVGSPWQSSSLTGKEGSPGQQESTLVPLLFLQTCGNLCLNLYGHPLTTPNRSASPTSSPYAIWTDTGTVMSPPMESTEYSSKRVRGHSWKLTSQERPSEAN